MYNCIRYIFIYLCSYTICIGIEIEQMYTEQNKNGINEMDNICISKQNINRTRDAYHYLRFSTTNISSTPACMKVCKL